jgi:hypothetical protein
LREGGALNFNDIVFSINRITFAYATKDNDLFHIFIRLIIAAMQQNHIPSIASTSKLTENKSLLRVSENDLRGFGRL